MDCQSASVEQRQVAQNAVEQSVEGHWGVISFHPFIKWLQESRAEGGSKYFAGSDYPVCHRMEQVWDIVRVGTSFPNFLVQYSGCIEIGMLPRGNVVIRRHQ
jgi:hypothetical protein